MESLIHELDAIEKEHKEFFENKNIKLFQYISVSKKPIMIRFRKEVDNIYKLPDEVYKKVDNLIMSYYSI